MAIIVGIGVWLGINLYPEAEPILIKNTDGKCILVASIVLDLSIGFNTIYGEQPQLAIWLENEKTNEIKTIYVTSRAGKDDWSGKIMCQVALPFWESRSGALELNKILRKTEFDAVSSATPNSEELHVEALLDSASVWKYFIEVNLSGDYNEMFNLYPNNTMDSEGNGQPSLIYGGSIAALNGEYSEPTLLGRTGQIAAISSIITDVNGITTAKDIIKKVKLKVFK